MTHESHLLRIVPDGIWLLDQDGRRLCDLEEMQLLDFGDWISVESGMHCYELRPAERWRLWLLALGLEFQ